MVRKHVTKIIESRRRKKGFLMSHVLTPQLFCEQERSQGSTIIASPNPADGHCRSRWLVAPPRCVPATSILDLKIYLLSARFAIASALSQFASNRGPFVREIQSRSRDDENAATDRSKRSASVIAHVLGRTREIDVPNGTKRKSSCALGPSKPLSLSFQIWI